MNTEHRRRKVLLHAVGLSCLIRPSGREAESLLETLQPDAAARLLSPWLQQAARLKWISHATGSLILGTRHQLAAGSTSPTVAQWEQLSTPADKLPSPINTAMLHSNALFLFHPQRLCLSTCCTHALFAGKLRVLPAHCSTSALLPWSPLIFSCKRTDSSKFWLYIPIFVWQTEQGNAINTQAFLKPPCFC